MYNDRVDDLRAKGFEMSELIIKARHLCQNNLSDVEMESILKRWEESNVKLLQKYPEKDAKDYTLLDDAAEEVKRRRAAAETLSQLKEDQEDLVMGANRKDDDLGQYLSKVKQLEEPLSPIQEKASSKQS